MTAEQPRSIRSIEEIKSILAGGRFTFDEMLDGVRVARIYDDWGLVERCALEALKQVGNRPITSTRLKEVARQVAIALLKQVGPLENVRSALNRSAVEVRRAATSSQIARVALEDELKFLNEVALLCSDSRVPSYVALCARLRRLDRADLGVVAATRALELEPENSAALTTRGAAFLDLENLPKAREDLESAWALGPSAFVAVAMARLELLDRSDGVSWWVEEAHSLMTSSDNGGASQIHNGLSASWPLYLAGSQFIRDGQIGDAIRVARAVNEISPYLSDLLHEEIRGARRNRRTTSFLESGGS